MTAGCFYCLEKANEISPCVTQCLSQSNIPSAYPASILFGSLGLAIGFFFFAMYFRNDLKRFIGCRLASIAFLSTAVFTTGLIFNGHFILRNLPIIIPTVGIGSYLFSYLLSFYLVKLSYNK